MNSMVLVQTRFVQFCGQLRTIAPAARGYTACQAALCANAEDKFRVQVLIWQAQAIR